MGDFLGFFSIIFAVLFIASLSGLVSERIGIINIGINGMMVIGALTFSLVGHLIGHGSNYLQLVALLITCLVTGLFALLHGFACITLKANHIISGMAINILASGMGLFFVSIPTFAKAGSIFTNFQLLSFDNSGIFNIFIIIALILGVVTFIFLKKTVMGMRYKSIGENPYAADSMGINVIKMKYIGVLLSGIFAGISGSAFTFYTSSAFFGNVQGEGFIALAILITGQWRVEFIFTASVLFSLIVECAKFIPAMPSSPSIISNNSSLFNILPFVLTIISMIIFSKGSKMPKALGRPFNKDTR